MGRWEEALWQQEWFAPKARGGKTLGSLKERKLMWRAHACVRACVHVSLCVVYAEANVPQCMCDDLRTVAHTSFRFPLCLGQGFLFSTTHTRSSRHSTVSPLISL